MTTIVTKNGSGAPLASDLVQGELAVDLTNKRLYTEDSGGSVIELGTNPSTIDINAGTIDGTVIGGASAAAGTFTTFTSTGIDDNATSTAITIDASQNVGIGATSPGAPLQIGGASAGDAALWFNTSGTSYSEIESVTFGFNYNMPLVLQRQGGNVGIGTTSPTSKLHVRDVIRVSTSGTGDTATDGTVLSVGASGEAYLYNYESQPLIFATSATERMRIDSSGNVGIGTSSPNSVTKLQVEDTTASSTSTYISVVSGNGGNAGVVFGDSDADLVGGVLFNNADNALRFFKSGFTEAARIDSSGNLLVGATSNPDNFKFRVVSNLPPIEAYRQETIAGNGVLVCYSNVGGTRTTRMYVRNDGGIANYQSNDVNLSDPRAKEEIANAGGYLNKLCAIPVINFKYKNEPDGKLNIGVLTTDVEAVAPELVDKECWEFEGEMLDAVFEGDMKYAMLKAIQEQQVMIEELKAEVALLKGA